ncbi:ATP-grasp fold domain-containing protein [Hypomontagnella monticulosa]|nr:ATP-grasp fold domain-containing protein [Hypomontagnella monticulosa]
MECQRISSQCPVGFFSFETDVANKRAHLNCHWRLNGITPEVDLEAPVENSRASPCLTLDLLFTPLSIWPRDQKNANPPRDASMWSESNETEAVHGFIQDAIEANINNNGPSITAIKLLLPATSGYIIRNDIIQRRFLSCQLAESVADFTTVGEKISAFDHHVETTILQSLVAAVGAIHLKQLPGFDRELVECATAILENEITTRLSFPWIVESPLPRTRLALVDGKMYPAPSTTSLGMYRAARALGIELVVLDRDGHWAQNPSAKQWRDEFIVCDLTEDDGLPSRIVNALANSKGPIHGITTYTDKLLPSTARAAERMGLYTSSPEAMDICHDKRKTRKFTSTGINMAVSGLTDLKKGTECLSSPLRYPLIVKPAVGYRSEGVAKVTSRTELFSAVQRIEEQFPGIDAVIEPYVFGPEVDANFFLFNRELLWSEVNDDFPSTADTSLTGTKLYEHHPSSLTESSRIPIPSSPPPNSFVELSTIMPSMLPGDEVSLLTSSLTGTLLKLGFRNGFFHLEARVKDSKMEYAMTDKGIDLIHVKKDTDVTTDPSVFLIEINARPPGHQEIYAVEHTYGIDYFALHMLAALSTHVPNARGKTDPTLKTILHSLCEPLPTECRYPSHIVFIPITRGGTFVGAEPLPKELAQYVVECEVFLERGEVLGDPEKEGKWPFVAYFLVSAKLTGVEGRTQVRLIGERIREAFKYTLT